MSHQTLTAVGDAPVGRRRGQLFRKYVVIIVALVSGALLASGLVQTYFSYQENRTALGRIQREKAATARTRIEQFIRETERQIGWTLQPPFLAAGVSPEQRSNDYNRLLRQVPAITEVSYLDATGKEQLRISRLTRNVLGSGTDFSQDPKFLAARAGGTYYSPVYFRNESEPYMTIARAEEGRDAGVTVAEVNLKFIWDVVSQIKIGKAGAAYVVDPRGQLIAHPDISLVLQKTDLSALPQVQAAQAGAPRPGDGQDATLARDPQGRQVLTAWESINPPGWTVFVDQPQAEALAPLYASLTRSALLLLGGLALAVLASLALARKMVRPIRALQTGAARIGAGALDQRIEVRTGDELEALADEFNRMSGRLRESYATLEQKVEERTRELAEALEQQTAMAEVLRVISRSPTNLQPVLDAVVRNAAQLCDATDAVIFRPDGERLRPAAVCGAMGDELGRFPEGGPLLRRTTVTGRAMLEKQTLHVHDLVVELAEYPDSRDVQQHVGHRTMLATPLLREGAPIGVLAIFRREVRPFTDQQIALLETFADQAVIAIENARLFSELQERNAALRESLEQQTAVAAVLQGISRSAFDLQAVLDTLVASATQLLGRGFSMLLRREGRFLNLAALHIVDDAERAAGVARAARQAYAAGLPLDHPFDLHAVVVREKRPRAFIGRPGDPRLEHVAPGIRAVVEQFGVLATLAVPLLAGDEVIGTLEVSRHEDHRFTDQEITLLQTFADQAVIAIENTRLFEELQTRNRDLAEALEQQTATSEVLRIISSSPTDLQPVLDAVAESAARLCEAYDAVIIRVEGDMRRMVAHYGPIPAISVDDQYRNTRGTVVGRAIIDRRTIHIHDMAAESEAEFPEGKELQRRYGHRTLVATPLLREGVPIGVIMLRRMEVRPFSDKQIALLQTFADQAVIAIENARLFRELQEQLEQQTATSEILRVISS